MGGQERMKMLPPGIIERIKREREERDRPASQLPLYPIDIAEIDRHKEEDEEKKESSHVIVIDLV